MSGDNGPLGNYGSITTDGTSQTRQYNDQNEVTGVGSHPLTFDANGNVTTDEHGNTLIYDAWNRLVSVTGTHATSYSYDGLNRRITENHDAGTTMHLYYSAQWQVLEERQGNTVTAQNVWSPVYVDALVLVDQNPDTVSAQRLYVQQDANWNVTAVVNGSGVQQRFEYTPFGVQTVLEANFTASGSSAMIAYASQGLRLDSVIGDYENRGRVKDPVLQRFLQGDPAKADISTYRVEGNNPTGATDPTGLDPKEGDVKDRRVTGIRWTPGGVLPRSWDAGFELLDNLDTLEKVSDVGNIVSAASQGLKDLAVALIDTAATNGMNLSAQGKPAINNIANIVGRDNGYGVFVEVKYQSYDQYTSMNPFKWFHSGPNYEWREHTVYFQCANEKAPLNTGLWNSKVAREIQQRPAPTADEVKHTIIEAQKGPLPEIKY